MTDKELLSALNHLKVETGSLACLGSGSSRIAAYDMGYDFVGCEIDPDYFAAQEKRFADYTAQMRIEDY